MFLENIFENTDKPKKFVLYVNGNPVSYYDNIRDAREDQAALEVNNKDIEIDIRQEVCHDVPVNEDLTKGQTIDISKNFQNYKTLIGKIEDIDSKNRIKIKIVHAELEPGKKGDLIIGKVVTINKNYLKHLKEDLRKWFKEKWVRFGPDGKIRGQCARDDDSEGKPKCLPQAKAQALGKKGRKYAASKKRREDPNPERSGKAINVNTKKKSNEGVAEGGPFSYDAKKPRQGSVADLAAKKRREQEKGKQPIEPRDQMVGVAKVTKGVAESLDDFHRKLAQQIKDRIARTQTNLAVMKAQHPELWQWKPGDQVYSKKTGKIYTIKGLALNQKNEAMYNYQRGEDEKSENYERGRLIADLAHKTLVKVNEETTTEGQVIPFRKYEKPTNIIDELSISEKVKNNLQIYNTLNPLNLVARLKQDFPGQDLATIQKEITRQNNENRLGSIIETEAAIEEDQIEETVSLDDLEVLLNFSKKENQLGNVKKLEREIQSRQSEIREGEVIHQRFGQGRKRSNYKKNPDINIPHYDSQRQTVYHPDHPDRGEPESFATFLVEPSKYSNVFKIIGITKDDQKIQVATTSNQELANTLVDAYLRDGYTDKDIERVDISKDKHTTKPKLKLIKTDESKCPHCGGVLLEYSKLNEKKDSCYYKVKSRYKVWPSAYASGALVQCRKKGSKNWGSKSESISEDSPQTSATLDPNFHTAIRDIESRNNPQAVSRKGARGTMQVMPKTLRNPGYGVQPAQNNSPAELERVGKDYFNAMLDKYGGDKRMALIAYNMGPSATDRWASTGGDFNKLPKETQGYVPKVFDRYTELTQTNFPQTSGAATTTTNTTGTTGTTAPITQTSVQQTARDTATAQNALLGRSISPRLPTTLEENGKHYFKIPQSLCNDDLREQFQLRHDLKGWYLRESQQNFKKLYFNASKAFTALEGLDLSKGNGSVPTQGDDVVTSPVGSIPKAQRKNAKKIH